MISLPTITGQCSATIIAPTATDACAGTIAGTTTSPLTFNIQGEYLVTWTYDDSNGNTSTQTQIVVVADTIAPLGNVSSLPTITSECSATLTPPTATDNCAGTITATTTASLTYNTQGNYLVSWTYDDGNGNISTQTQIVVITNGGTIVTYYQDLDGDAFGNPNFSNQACDQPIGYVLDNTDCNDNQIQYADGDGDGFGSNAQVACGVTNNNDCNDNDETQNVLITFFQDLDGDSFGNSQVTIQACTQPEGYALDNTDCNDNQIQYADNDGDGFGSNAQVACGVTNNNDCNDANPSIHALTTYYQDLDGDGFGNSNLTVTSCIVPIGYVTNGNDCNDNNVTVFPGAIDICGDGIDNDCNGVIDNLGQAGGCTPVLTAVQGPQCGTTLATIDQNIFANLVSGAQGYRFRVTRMINGMPSTNPADVQTIDTFLRVFRMTQLARYAFNTTYQVEVSTRRNNIWQPFYGFPCTVTTPTPTTSVQASQCASTLTSMNDIIYANGISFATGYRFRVTNTVTSQSQTIDRSLREFRMNNFSNIDFNTTYNVEVAIRNINGTYLPYGSICTITTPSMPFTKLINAQCGSILESFSEIIYADLVANSNAYRFKITNAQGFSFILERATRTFTLEMIPGLLIGNPYEVAVSAKINGVFGPYGTICTIITPGTNSRTSSASNQVDYKTEMKVYAYPSPFSDNFSLKIENVSNEVIKVSIYDMTGRLLENRKIVASDIETSSFGSNYPSGVYNINLTQEDDVKTIRIIKR
jgi:hypothetical protein